MRKSKSFKLESLLEQRIKLGDYALVHFPSERKLAAAEGVSQMTARKAIMGLKRRGLLEKLSNRTVSPLSSGPDKGGVFALLAPAYPSYYIMFWQRILAHQAYATGWRMKLVLYTHWDDPMIEETIAGFDGIFLFSISEPMPARVKAMLSASKAPLVSLGQDMCASGIPSILVHPEDSVPKMLEYLESLGHKRIDCLNTQPHDPSTVKKMEAWKSWLLAHGLKGRLFDEPVESYGHSFEKALDYVGGILKKGSFESDCLFCTTEGAAIGTCRALASHGISPGRDVSVCSASDEGLSRFFCPSITSIKIPDHSSDMSLALDWMRKGGGPWEGPMLLGAKGGEIFIGESTSRASKTKAVKPQHS